MKGVFIMNDKKTNKVPQKASRLKGALAAALITASSFLPQGNAEASDADTKPLPPNNTSQTTQNSPSDQGEVLPQNPGESEKDYNKRLEKENKQRKKLGLNLHVSAFINLNCHPRMPRPRIVRAIPAPRPRILHAVPTPHAIPMVGAQVVVQGKDTTVAVGATFINKTRKGRR